MKDSDNNKIFESYYRRTKQLLNEMVPPVEMGSGYEGGMEDDIEPGDTLDRGIGIGDFSRWHQVVGLTAQGFPDKYGNYKRASPRFYKTWQQGNEEMVEKGIRYVVKHIINELAEFIEEKGENGVIPDDETSGPNGGLQFIIAEILKDIRDPQGRPLFKAGKNTLYKNGERKMTDQLVHLGRFFGNNLIEAGVLKVTQMPHKGRRGATRDPEMEDDLEF